LSSPRLQELSYAFIGQLWPAQQILVLSHGQSALCTRQESFSTIPNNTPQKKETIAEIRARIFDEHVGDGRKSGRKVLLKRLKGKIVADWYAMLRPALPLLEDEQEAGRLVAVAHAKSQGKTPPKKGQTKRSGKR